MKFLNKQIIHPDGDSKLQNKKFFNFRVFSQQPNKPDFTLRFLPVKRIFHSNENQHFNLINVGFFLINRKQTS